MPNERWRQPRGEFRPDIGTLALVIVIIGIIGYLLFPAFFKDISNSTVTDSGIINQPSTTDPSALYSPNSSSQLFPSVNNTMNLGIENNAITSGYGVLYVSNGVSQQLSVSAQDYAFLQGLFQTDNKGSGAITVFLADNGQIHRYIVSNETYSIICNIASIKSRVSNAATNSTLPATTLPTTTTAISETLTVSNPSTFGFTVSVNPPLNGLTVSNFSLVNSLGNPVALTRATTSLVGGATYAITTVLSVGQTYTLTATAAGYTFGSAQNVVVPQ